MNAIRISGGSDSKLLRMSLLACCLGLTGCSTFATSAASKANASRSTHRDADLSAFEQKRDEAQYIAARDRVENGDLSAAETLLNSILERTPNHADSRLLLADLYVAQDRTADAEKHLRLVLEQRPNHPRAHHSLGLLCDVTGRAEEAADHFRRAAEAAPQEESYRVSLEASLRGQRDSEDQIAQQ
jgi:predicted Zn-dependent protease